ncbi:hypothetical protein Droror1_Dr00017715 [Drosera rotundifolia]
MSRLNMSTLLCKLFKTSTPEVQVSNYPMHLHILYPILLVDVLIISATLSDEELESQFPLFLFKFQLVDLSLSLLCGINFLPYLSVVPVSSQRSPCKAMQANVNSSCPICRSCFWKGGITCMIPETPHLSAE